MDITAISSGVTAARALVELLKGARDLNDAVKLNEVIVMAQDHIVSVQQSLLDAQASLFELSEKNRELEARLAAIHDWNERKKKYELRDNGRGLLLYEYIRSNEGDPTPAHKACPTCFEKRHISLLQHPDPKTTQVVCMECRFTGLDSRPGAQPPSRPA